MVYTHGQRYNFETKHQIRYHEDKKHYFCGYCMKYVKNVLNHIDIAIHIANKEIFEEEQKQIREEEEYNIYE
jgi:hypothetical protein